MRKIPHKLAVARGELPAELLFRNVRLVNVLSGEIHSTHVAVDDGRVIGFGNYSAKRVVNLRGAYLAPSLIELFHVREQLVLLAGFLLSNRCEAGICSL